MRRRDFLQAGACSVLYLGCGSVAAEDRTVAQQPWGSFAKLADGVWGLTSAPLDDPTTVCNGGLIAGKHGVLAVEAFASPQGATWVAEQAVELAGHWPAHAVITHYHGDHANGVAGYRGEGGRTEVHITAASRDRVLETDRKRESGPDEARAGALQDATLIAEGKQTSIDLGERTVRIVPRSGHTSSDVTIELDEPSVIFCGDLVWNTMFPNYVDAIPSKLSSSVRGLIRRRPTVYFPGHGVVADNAAMQRFVQLIDTVEEAAREAVRAGVPAAQAARDFRVPEALGEWFLFSDRYYERALLAWERELLDTAPD